MLTFVQVLDFIGTFAFAISGIRLASAKQFDWFGAYVVGLATAIGGGTIRDVLLDVTPGWMTDPIYLICTGLALFWVIAFGKYLIHMHNTFFLFDSIGLALFTVVGVGKSIALGYPFWVAISWVVSLGPQVVCSAMFLLMKFRLFFVKKFMQWPVWWGDWPIGYVICLVWKPLFAR